MATIENLVASIQEEALRLQEEEALDDSSYYSFFEEAVATSLRETLATGRSDEFIPLVMINFILTAVEEGADAESIRTFLRGNGLLSTQEVEEAWAEEAEGEDEEE